MILYTIMGFTLWSLGCFTMGVFFVRTYDENKEAKRLYKERFGAEKPNVRGTYTCPVNSLPPPDPRTNLLCPSCLTVGQQHCLCGFVRVSHKEFFSMVDEDELKSSRNHMQRIALGLYGADASLVDYSKGWLFRYEDLLKKWPIEKSSHRIRGLIDKMELDRMTGESGIEPDQNFINEDHKKVL